MSASARRRWLASALLALGLVYVGWYAGRPMQVAAWLLLAAPAFVLSWRVGAGGARAPFWAGLLALVWFSHGISEAWTVPADRPWALGAVALSLAIITLASLPGLRARFAKKAG